MKILLLGLMIAGTGWGELGVMERAQLRGLECVRVRIDSLRELEHQAGLTESALSALAAEKLSRAGITVSDTYCGAELGLNVAVLEFGNRQGFCYSIRLELTQSALLMREFIPVNSVLVLGSSLGTCPNSWTLVQEIGKYAAQYADRFVEEYIRANKQE
jgi:hypothetical protein